MDFDTLFHSFWSFTVTGLANGTRYQFVMTATNAVGSGNSCAAERGEPGGTAAHPPSRNDGTAESTRRVATGPVNLRRRDRRQ